MLQPKYQTQDEFDFKYGAKYESYGLHIKKIFRNRVRPYLDQSGKFSCRQFTVKNAVRLCPLTWLVSEYIAQRGHILLYDALAGFTVLAMCVPQSLAYGQLTGLGAVFGLYTTTFPLFVYFILGTSRQLSVGTEAAISLVAGSVVAKYIPQVQNSSNSIFTTTPTTSQTTSHTTTTHAPTSTNPPTTTSVYDNPQMELMLNVNAAVTLLVGIIQLAMYVLRLGFLTALFSNAMVSGYTTGLAVVVLSSQVPSMFGYSATSYTGPVSLYYYYYNLFANIAKFNAYSFSIGLVSIILLVLTITLLQPRLQRLRWYPPLPFPTPLLLIIAGTGLSYGLNLNKLVGVQIVGTIPAGFPHPVLPSFELMGQVWLDAVLLALLSFTVSISLARIYAKEHGYTIESNQELLAIGACNTVGSFLRCYVAAGSLSRSSVQNNAGGRTQLVSLLVGIGMLLLLVFLAPLFQPVPKSILAAIIMVALRGLFLQVTELPKLWRTSIVDFAVWACGFFGTVLLDEELGFIVAIVASVSAIVFRSMFSHSSILAILPDGSGVVESAVYLKATEKLGVKIFRFDGALHFASFDYFVSKIVARTGLDPQRLAARAQQKASSHTDPASTIEPTIPPAPGEDAAGSSNSKAVELPNTASSISLDSDDYDHTRNYDDKSSPMPQLPGAISLASSDVVNASMPQFPGAISLVSMDNKAAPIIQYPGAVSLASVDYVIQTMPQFPGATSLVSSDVEENENTRLPSVISISNNTETSESRLEVNNLLKLIFNVKLFFKSSISPTTLSPMNATTSNDTSAATAKTNGNTSKESSTEFQHSHASTKNTLLQVNKLSSPEMNAVIDLSSESVKCSSLSQFNTLKSGSQSNHVAFKEDIEEDMGQSSGELSNVQSSSAEGNCSASADKESRANHLVLDCAGWAYVDATAVERLAELVVEYHKGEVEVYLAATTPNVRRMLLRCDFAKHVKFERTLLFPSVLDAVHFALNPPPPRPATNDEEAAVPPSIGAPEQQAAGGKQAHLNT